MGYSAFARHYSRNPLLSSSYLDVSVRTVPLPATAGMTALEHRRVSPFGYLRLSRSYTPHRRFSQYNTSFIGTRCLGIHCVPLLAFRTIVRSLRLSRHATYRYYLRVDYSILKTHSPRFLHSIHYCTISSIQNQALNSAKTRKTQQLETRAIGARRPVQKISASDLRSPTYSSTLIA